VTLKTEIPYTNVTQATTMKSLRKKKCSFKSPKRQFFIESMNINWIVVGSFSCFHPHKKIWKTFDSLLFPSLSYSVNKIAFSNISYDTWLHCFVIIHSRISFDRLVPPLNEDFMSSPFILHSLARIFLLFLSKINWALNEVLDDEYKSYKEE
jgi:hypothetical protein